MPNRISTHDPYIRPEYLPAEGRAYRIASWSSERVRRTNGEEATQPVITMSNGSRLILNVTNLRRLAALFNDDQDATIGQAIVLLPGKISGKATVIIDRIAKTPSQETHP